MLFSHQPASSFLQISGIVSASEDDIVVPPNDEEIFGINSEVRCGIRNNEYNGISARDRVFLIRMGRMLFHLFHTTQIQVVKPGFPCFFCFQRGRPPLSLEDPNDTFFYSQWALTDYVLPNRLSTASDINWKEGRKIYERDSIGGRSGLLRKEQYYSSLFLPAACGMVKKWVKFRV